MEQKQMDFSFVAIGFGEAGKLNLEKMVDTRKVKFIDSTSEFENFIDQFQIETHATMIVGSQIQGIGAMEFGQTLRACYRQADIVFVTSNAESFVPEELKKNGYSRALLLPLDNVFFEEAVSKASKGHVTRRYKSIKMIDLQPGQKLNFSVYGYMPLNQKYLLLTAKGLLSEKQYRLLKDRSQSAVYIEYGETEKFYEYGAQRLAALSQKGSESISETERLDRLRICVQQLFHHILDSGKESDFNSGRELMEQTHQVVQKFVKIKTKVDLMDQVRNALEVGSDAYSHIQSVSSIACLLSLALSVGNPEDLAIAGLFHDIGISGFDQEINPFDLGSLSKPEQDLYKKHPLLSVMLLKNKKLTLTPFVTELIEKHHERVDGKGYPNQLPAYKIPLEAQLLSIADQLEYLLRHPVDGARLSPLEAIEKIRAHGGVSIELIIKLNKFFGDQSAVLVA